MKKRAFAMLLVLPLALSGCLRGGAGTEAARAEKPPIPEKLEADESGVPTLRVHDISTKQTERLDLESYVEGVVAGEMKNDWPLEALKAQAILARTFTLKFCQDKESRYDGADISTDVAEAQAYNAGAVNDRVRRAVRETAGVVMAVDGQYPYAWFHAHAGGMTELPTVALDFRDDDPAYLRPVASEESEDAPESVRHWQARFTLDEVRKACADAGVSVGEVDSVTIGEKGASGRAKTLLVNGQPVSAPSFRIRIGANALRSTLIEDISVGNGEVVFTGRGFGHGVGLSQWGAYAMAKKGADAKEMILHYFPGVELVRLW